MKRRMEDGCMDRSNLQAHWSGRNTPTKEHYATGKKERAARYTHRTTSKITMGSKRKH